MKIQLFLTVVLIGVGAAWVSAHRANKAHAAISALTEEQTLITKTIEEANARLARARKTTEDLRVKIRSLSTTASTAKTAVEAAPSSSSRIIEDSPNLQNLQAAARRAQLVITYGPLYRSLVSRWSRSINSNRICCDGKSSMQICWRPPRIPARRSTLILFTEN